MDPGNSPATPRVSKARMLELMMAEHARRHEPDLSALATPIIPEDMLPSDSTPSSAETSGNSKNFNADNEAAPGIFANRIPISGGPSNENAETSDNKGFDADDEASDHDPAPIRKNVNRPVANGTTASEHASRISSLKTIRDALPTLPAASGGNTAATASTTATTTSSDAKPQPSPPASSPNYERRIQLADRNRALIARENAFIRNTGIYHRVTAAELKGLKKPAMLDDVEGGVAKHEAMVAAVLDAFEAGIAMREAVVTTLESSEQTQADLRVGPVISDPVGIRKRVLKSGKEEEVDVYKAVVAGVEIEYDIDCDWGRRHGPWAKELRAERKEKQEAEKKKEAAKKGTQGGEKAVRKEDAAGDEVEDKREVPEQSGGAKQEVEGVKKVEEEEGVVKDARDWDDAGWLRLL